jgi:hypothetical protein
MGTNPNSDHNRIGPRLIIQRGLHLQCGSERVSRDGKGSREGIARPGKDVTAMLGEDVADDLVVTMKSGPHEIGMLLPQLARSFDVGEHEGHRATRSRRALHSC